MGLHGMNARSKVMGFLILCAGRQFVGNGLPGIATDPAMLSTIRDDLKN
jgi:multiple antibiotic resistance protein